MSGPADAAPPPAGRSRTRRIGGLVTGVVIFAFLLWGLVRGWSQVSDFDWQLDPPLLAAAVAVVFCGYLASGVGYLIVVNFLGVPGEVSRFELLSGWARALLGRYVPGTVVMLASRVVLGREAGVPARVTLAASVYEQVLLLTTAALASLAFVVAYEDSGVSWVLLAVAIAGGLGLVHPRVFRPLSTWMLKKAGREPLDRFLSGAHLLALLLYYAFVNALMGTGVWLLIHAAAGADAGDLAYVALAFLLSFTLGMLAWIVPSGLGVRDAAFALALGRNVGDGVAIALAAGVRIAVTLIELGFIAVVAGAHRILRGRTGRRAPE